MVELEHVHSGEGVSRPRRSIHTPIDTTQRHRPPARPPSSILFSFPIPSPRYPLHPLPLPPSPSPYAAVAVATHAHTAAALAWTCSAVASPQLPMTQFCALAWIKELLEHWQACAEGAQPTAEAAEERQGVWGG